MPFGSLFVMLGGSASDSDREVRVLFPSTDSSRLDEGRGVQVGEAGRHNIGRPMTAGRERDGR